MGNFVNLSTAIKTVLVGIQQNGAAAFSDIQELPTLEFSGYPAVTIAPSDTQSEYATDVQNFRTYAFAIDVFYPVEDASTVQGYAIAFDKMRYLMDLVIDAFDNSNDLNNACQILRPTPSQWQVVETSASVMLTARINLRCALTVTTNNG